MRSSMGNLWFGNFSCRKASTIKGDTAPVELWEEALRLFEIAPRHEHQVCEH